MKLLIIDFNRTLFDPIEHQILTGAVKALKLFKRRGFVIVLLTTESKDRLALINQLGLNSVIDKLEFVKQKTASGVESLINNYQADIADMLIVGDDPEGELLIGANLNIPTIAVGTGFCDVKKAKELGIGFCKSIDQLSEVYYA